MGRKTELEKARASALDATIWLHKKGFNLLTRNMFAKWTKSGKQGSDASIFHWAMSDKGKAEVIEAIKETEKAFPVMPDGQGASVPQIGGADAVPDPGSPAHDPSVPQMGGGDQNPIPPPQIDPDAAPAMPADDDGVGVGGPPDFGLVAAGGHDKGPDSVGGVQVDDEARRATLQDLKRAQVLDEHHYARDTHAELTYKEVRDPTGKPIDPEELLDPDDPGLLGEVAGAITGAISEAAAELGVDDPGAQVSQSQAADMAASLLDVLREEGKFPAIGASAEVWVDAPAQGATHAHGAAPPDQAPLASDPAKTKAAAIKKGYSDDPNRGSVTMKGGASSAAPTQTPAAAAKAAAAAREAEAAKAGGRKQKGGDARGS